MSPQGKRLGLGSTQTAFRQTFVPSGSPTRGPPLIMQAFPTGQSPSTSQPAARLSQNPTHRPPQPSDGSSPHCFASQLFSHGHGPHTDPSVPQPPPSGSLTQMGGRHTFGNRRPSPPPRPMPQ